MTIAITNARLFDATGAPVVEDATIVVEGDRIAAAGAGIAVPDGVERLDASGAFVMPGLIDMHVHVAMSGGQSSLYGFLATGVTTVRDLGGNPDVTLALRDEVARGERVGPRMAVFGPFVEGEPPVFGAQAGRAAGPGGRAEQGALAGRGAGMWAHETTQDIERTVDTLLERGVDGIKLYAGLRPDLVAHAIRYVDKRVFVAGHLGRTWASEAVAAGIDGLEHVHATFYQDVARPEDRHEREGGNGAKPNYWTWLSEGWSRADLASAEVERFVESLARHRVVVSPTAVLATNGMATTEARDEPGLAYLPREQRERMRMRREAAEQWAGGLTEQMRKQWEAEGRPLPRPVDPEVGARAMRNELAFLRMVHEAGGIVVPSTDVGPTPAPGFSLHRELSLHARAGIPVTDVLQNATRVAAGILKLDAEIGTIEPGKIADLVVIDGDPLQDVNATRNVRAVIKGGVVHDPQELLARIETA